MNQAFIKLINVKLTFMPKLKNFFPYGMKIAAGEFTNKDAVKFGVDATFIALSFVPVAGPFIGLVTLLLIQLVGLIGY